MLEGLGKGNYEEKDVNLRVEEDSFGLMRKWN